MAPSSEAVEAAAEAWWRTRGFVGEWGAAAVFADQQDRVRRQMRPVIDALVAGGHYVPAVGHNAQTWRERAISLIARAERAEADLAEAKAEIARLLAEAADQEQRWNASHEYARISEYRRRTHAAERDLASAKALLADLNAWIFGGDCYKHLPDEVTKRLRAFLAGEDQQ